MDKVRNFLKERGLTLSDTKTLITNINHEKAKFLGANIFRTSVTTYGRRNRGFLMRDNKTIKLTAPVDRVLKKLANAGFMEKGISAPKHK